MAALRCPNCNAAGTFRLFLPESDVDASTGEVVRRKDHLTFFVGNVDEHLMTDFREVYMCMECGAFNGPMALEYHAKHWEDKPG